ncbi:hypothetical protein BDN72DRAFT_874554 [Pluteus cervinus]|uniref:Uncharacterized protein n=1 Tax=Pluteus cervinus TaxID=181527 RepID=A0ACD3BCC8_9AGAR|nr:hypothetical protein BDN72DRAFT_874554 [Pluteus cervinus]
MTPSLVGSEPMKTSPSVALSQGPAPNLVDFLNTLPPFLTLLVVNLAPYASRFRYTVEVVSWRKSWYDAWLALALWWAFCLFITTTLRYFVPIAALFCLLFFTSKPAPPVVTEQAVQFAIADLSTLQPLLPQLPSLRQLRPTHPLRVVGIVYVPYLILTHFIPLRVIIAVLGSIVLVWRAPWAVVLRSTIWSSAWFRWSVYKTWAYVSGNPLPPRAMSPQSVASAASTINSLRFLYTVYENQRWWMGLDWTAALLPNERPSWCSASLQPASPPNGFTLPEDTTIYLPNGRGGRTKRTARWRWEEPEWKVLVRKDGTGSMRVDRPLPVTKEDSQSANKLMKVAGIFKDSTAPSSPLPKGGDSEIHVEDPEDPEEEPWTDVDGWVYGDNKWEGQSGKGGMGKYTRYRRWTRVAVVAETVEIVGVGDLGIQRHHPPVTVDPPQVDIQVEEEQFASKPMERNSSTSPLRQRLKALTRSSSNSNT